MPSKMIGTGRGRNGGVSQKEGVRQALESIGGNPMPGEIQDYLRSNFGIELSKDKVSNIKSDLLRQEAKENGTYVPKLKKKPAKRSKPVQPIAVPGPNAPAPKAAISLPPKAANISLEDVLTVKSLLTRCSAASLKALIDAFAV